MKRILVVWLLCGCSFCFAQKTGKNLFQVGIRGGFDLTEATGLSVNGGEKKGFTAGLLFQLKLSRNWTSEIDLLFIQKGSKSKGDPQTNYSDLYYLRLDYFECPLLFQFHRKKMIYEFGPGFGYLVFAREFDYNRGKGQGNLSNDNPFHQTELNFNMGLSYEPVENWTFNCRYTNSILPVRSSIAKTHAFDKIGTLNCVLAFALVYTIDLKRTKDHRTALKKSKSKAKAF